MNTIGGGVIQGINKAIDLAETDYRGLVISNTGQNFSAGANVGMIFMMAVEQDYDELNMAVGKYGVDATGVMTIGAPNSRRVAGVGTSLITGWSVGRYNRCESAPVWMPKWPQRTLSPRSDPISVSITPAGGRSCARDRIGSDIVNTLPDHRLRPHAADTLF